MWSWSQAATLLAYVQDPRKTWLATGSLLTVWWKMPVPGVETAVAPCLVALGVTCLPVCLWRAVGRGLYAAS